MPVYADVLFVLNGFINYLMLLCNMKILKLKTSRLRLLTGAVVGSIFAFKIFLPQFPQIIEFLLRITIITIIVACSYKFIALKEFIKAVIGFFAVNFGFSGLTIATIYFINPTELIYDNGIYYYDISFMSVVIFSCLSFAFITTAEKLLKKKVNNHFIYDTTVTLNQKSVTGRGLADTGNTLKEPFSNNAVIIANYDAIKPIAPINIKAYFNSNKISCDTDEAIRIIPISTISGTGLLPAFKANEVTIKSSDIVTTTKNVYIAISQKKLCDGEFEFILNNSILEVDENAIYKKTRSKNKA